MTPKLQNVGMVNQQPSRNIQANSSIPGRKQKGSSNLIYQKDRDFVERMQFDLAQSRKSTINKDSSFAQHYLQEKMILDAQVTKSGLMNYSSSKQKVPGYGIRIHTQDNKSGKRSQLFVDKKESSADHKVQYTQRDLSCNNIQDNTINVNPDQCQHQPQLISSNQKYLYSSSFRNSAINDVYNDKNKQIKNNHQNIQFQPRNTKTIDNPDQINNRIVNKKTKNFFKLDKSLQNVTSSKCNTANGNSNQGYEFKGSQHFTNQELLSKSNQELNLINVQIKNKKKRLLNSNAFQQKPDFWKTPHTNSYSFNIHQFKQYINQLISQDIKNKSQPNYNPLLSNAMSASSSTDKKHNIIYAPSIKTPQKANIHKPLQTNNNSKISQSQPRHQQHQQFVHQQQDQYLSMQQSQIKNMLKSIMNQNSTDNKQSMHFVNTLGESLGQINDQQMNDLIQNFIIEHQKQQQLLLKVYPENQDNFKIPLQSDLTKKQKSYLQKQQIQMSNLIEQTATAYGSDENCAPNNVDYKQNSMNDKQLKFDRYQQPSTSVTSGQPTIANRPLLDPYGTHTAVNKQVFFIDEKVTKTSALGNNSSMRMQSPQELATLSNQAYNTCINNSSLEPLQEESNNNQSNTQQNQSIMQTLNQKNTKDLINFQDFDIEYAKLIAKQFPIYEENGKVIDYSNINEYQLELLALHEEYGEEKDAVKKILIFNQLANMDEQTFYLNKKVIHKRNDPAVPESKVSYKKHHLQHHKNIFSRKTYGPNVGREGGNPQYKKNVIQLEQERFEKEKQELIMKRKRNSNYIQKCIKLGNEYYNNEKLSSLNWLKKGKEPTGENMDDSVRIDDKNLQLLRKKQEILAKYNLISQENKLNEDEGLYRYSLTKGNNSLLVKRVLDTRLNWNELEQKHLTLFHFKWAPVSRCINYEQLNIHKQKKIVNHLERHDTLTTKDLLYLNMYKFCETQKLNVFQYMPVQFVLDLSMKNFIFEVDRFCQYFNSIEKVRKQNSENLSQRDQIKQINQLIATGKNTQHDMKYKNIINRKYTLEPEMYDGMNVWLIKPNDFNRGRGVVLFNTLEQLRKLMKEFSLGNEMDFYIHNVCTQILANEKNQLNRKSQGAAVEPIKTIEPKQQEDNSNVNSSEKIQKSQIQNYDAEIVEKPYSGQSIVNVNLTQNIKTDVFVIQKYIEKPFLLDDRKFDIRLWVMINMIDLNATKCYVFKEGYIRMSGHKFTLTQESIDSPLIHLTNNAIQQLDNNYGKHEEGNQLSFTQAENIAKKAGIDVDFYQIFEEDIIPIIDMTFKCVEGNKLNPNQRKNTFEIYGYDFMIDSKLKPWLIEVNTNPCLEETSTLLRQLLPRMLDDAFKLTIDVNFPPLQPEFRLPLDSKFPVGGYSSENMWHLVHTMRPQ